MPGQKSVLNRGVFYDGLIEGLNYSTQTISGKTNRFGQFKFRPGETVTFSIGSLVLGSSPAGEYLTPAHLVLEGDGNVKNIHNQKVTNITRFLQSFTRNGNIEHGIYLDESINQIVDKYRYQINFDVPEGMFGDNPGIKAIFNEINRTLRTPAQARNHLRRTLRGMKKETDVKISTRDGSYLLCDIFSPVKKGKYPVIMSLGAYGKAFWTGCIADEAEALRYEVLEDNYFEGKPLGKVPFFHAGIVFTELPSESFELANSFDWVPLGYIVIRVDGRGVGKSPGVFQQFSYQEALDYYDAIEWAGVQKWSNGKVGLWGASYYGMNQYNVAQFQPPHLKAMIPIGADIDSYRDYIYTGGGLFNMFNFCPRVVVGEWKHYDWLTDAKANPFDEPELYGPSGKICISPDMSKVTVPFCSGAGIEGMIHTRGSSEAYIQAASKNKKIVFLSEPGVHSWAYKKEFFEADVAFFDKYLKGIKNDVMKEPPAKIMILTGGTGYYWRYERDWPIPGTKYPRIYLNAKESQWNGDGFRKEYFSLQWEKPVGELSERYSADIKTGVDSSRIYGISFVSEPFKEEMVIAGYPKLVLWVSSSSYDMQIHVAIRVFDENNVEVQYGAGNPAMTRDFPVGHGALKASHRKLDLERSTNYRPYHTHLKKDYQPLKTGEVVETEIEIWPTTALIKKGHRIRIDIQPGIGYGINQPVIDPAGTDYQTGATNTVYTGPTHLSYLQLPVIPDK